MYQKRPDYVSAIRAFKAAQKLDPAVYTDEINWFNGLCYLMTGDNVSAESALKLVIDSPSSRNREAAIDLLNTLKKQN
jgi:Tfp pilus assembly protein PilF